MPISQDLTLAIVCIGGCGGFGKRSGFKVPGPVLGLSGSSPAKCTDKDSGFLASSKIHSNCLKSKSKSQAAFCNVEGSRNKHSPGTAITISQKQASWSAFNLVIVNTQIEGIRNESPPSQLPQFLFWPLINVESRRFTAALSVPVENRALHRKH